jgi:ElaB/YqjD/DUF883 family membrane-anchored ribosome-binding protein
MYFMATKTSETTDIQAAIADIADDVRTLLDVTANTAEKKVSAARKRVQASLDTAKTAYGRVQKNAVAKAKAADGYVRGNPYRAVGYAFGLGAVIGFLLRRRHSSDE